MLDILTSPELWIAFLALVTMEIILGIDNIVFISIVTNKLPQAQRRIARRIGISLALVMRLLLLSMIVWIVKLQTPIFDLGISGPLTEYGKPMFETAISVRDLILILGGTFLIWKATSEIHHNMDPAPASSVFTVQKASLGLAAAIIQIILLDIVFSIDSILTAIGMTDVLPIMIGAVLIAIGVMFFAAGPVSTFIHNNPSLVMLALAFLLMIGMVLIAEGFGAHLPKGYVYSAMAFSVFVETLNLIRRKRAVFNEAPSHSMPQEKQA